MDRNNAKRLAAAILAGQNQTPDPMSQPDAAGTSMGGLGALSALGLQAMNPMQAQMLQALNPAVPARQGGNFAGAIDPGIMRQVTPNPAFASRDSGIMRSAPSVGPAYSDPGIMRMPSQGQPLDPSAMARLRQMLNPAQSAAPY